jgi:hypothetical protein
MVTAITGHDHRVVPRQHVRIAGFAKKIAGAARRARYHATMKRSTRKLVIRRETIRALTQLDLVLAAGGGQNAQLADTAGAETGCPFGQRAAQLVGTADAGTGCPFGHAAPPAKP